MDAPHLLARHGEHAEGIIVAQIGFAGEREAAQIGEALQIARMDARFIELPTIGSDMVIGVLERPLQARQLQRLDRVTRGDLDRLQLCTLGLDDSLRTFARHGTLPRPKKGRTRLTGTVAGPILPEFQPRAKKCRAAIRSPASISPITSTPTRICASISAKGRWSWSRGM